MARVLVVEDEEIIRQSLTKLLTRNHFEVDTARSVADAQQHDLSAFDLVISDLKLPGQPGTDLIKLAGDAVPVLIMTSYASLKSAVDTMRMGAVDYIPKPFDNEELLKTIQRILDSQDQTQTFHTPVQASRGMIGTCAPMKRVFDVIHKVAQTDATVLIHGETGTGKELAAKAIHKESRRSAHNLICVNCAAIPETLIEAELFGHQKGAFTGASETRTGLVEAADKGTLFLDEIGELPLEAQARLLRVLQEGEVRPIGSVHSRKVNVRLVAATHRNLQKLVQENKFREDLFYRINVVNLDIPPLRERGKDILSLADHYLAKFCNDLGKPLLEIAPDTIQAMTTYPWPGNIRELENALQRAVILCNEDDPISHDLLGINLSLIEIDPGEYQAPQAPKTTVTDPPVGLSLEDYFTQFVIQNQDQMSETDLAKKLGISRKSLWERRQKLGIPRKKKRNG
ncbi:MAG: sigma-54-dependent transcriptional regulator [bacterium]